MSTTNGIGSDLDEIMKMAMLPRAQVSPRLLLGKMTVLAAKLEEEETEVPAEVFEALDNDGRRMCLTGLLAIMSAALLDRS